MGSQTPRCPAAPRHSGAPDIAFDHEKSLGTFGTYQFRRSIPCPHAPLPTLHRHPHGYRCTARGESWIGSSFFPGTLTLTPPPVSLAHSHLDCRAPAAPADSRSLAKEGCGGLYPHTPAPAGTDRGVGVGCRGSLRPESAIPLCHSELHDRRVGRLRRQRVPARAGALSVATGLELPWRIEPGTAGQHVG